MWNGSMHTVCMHAAIQSQAKRVGVNSQPVHYDGRKGNENRMQVNTFCNTYRLFIFVLLLGIISNAFTSQIKVAIVNYTKDYTFINTYGYEGNVISTKRVDTILNKYRANSDYILSIDTIVKPNGWEKEIVFGPIVHTNIGDTISVFGRVKRRQNDFKYAWSTNSKMFAFIDTNLKIIDLEKNLMSRIIEIEGSIDDIVFHQETNELILLTRDCHVGKLPHELLMAFSGHPASKCDYYLIRVNMDGGISEKKRIIKNLSDMGWFTFIHNEVFFLSD